VRARSRQVARAPGSWTFFVSPQAGAAGARPRHRRGRC
jgi:hypothetical protein